MNVQQFLLHHGLFRNPFADEDAASDVIFREHCVDAAVHPCWDKTFGNAGESTSAVLRGDRGSGKTALRLRMAEHLARHNRKFPDRRVFLIEYDDFDPFLDCFLGRAGRRRKDVDRLLRRWTAADHLDAILSLGVTRVVDGILETSRSPRESDTPLDYPALNRQQARDLLLLAAWYDRSPEKPLVSRWQRLRKTLRFPTARARWPWVLGIVLTLGVVAGYFLKGGTAVFSTPWPYALAAACWLPWLCRAVKRWWLARGVAKQLRVLHRDVLPLGRILRHFSRQELVGQPLPGRRATDDRRLVEQFLGVLRPLGYQSVTVLIDRVDSPAELRGSPDRQRTWLSPLLEGKLLQHPDLAFKLLLPGEAFPEHGEVPTLRWTGAMLHDVLNARLAACAVDGRGVTLGDLFDGEVTEARLVEALDQLGGPRQAQECFSDLLLTHNSHHTDTRPSWRISSETLEAVMARYGV